MEELRLLCARKLVFRGKGGSIRGFVCLLADMERDSLRTLFIESSETWDKFLKFGSYVTLPGSVGEFSIDSDGCDTDKLIEQLFSHLSMFQESAALDLYLRVTNKRVSLDDLFSMDGLSAQTYLMAVPALSEELFAYCKSLIDARA